MKETSQAFKENQWKPGESGNPAGRPKKIFTVLKEQGFSADDIKTAFKEMAWYTLGDLNQAANDTNKPIIVRIVAKQFYKAYKDADWGKVRDIIEHTIGRPTQEFKGSDILPVAVRLIAPEEELDNDSNA